MSDATNEKIKKLVERHFAAYVETAMSDHVRKVRLIMNLCESPIERLLVAGLMATFPRLAIDESKGKPFLRGQKIDITLQENVGIYRPDFLVYLMPDAPADTAVSSRIAIECDGKEFHGNRPDYDEARRKALQADGVATIRFTGAELFADARLCGARVSEAISRELQRRRVAGRSEHAK